MKLTKRILCLALVLALTFALCACGKKDEEETKSTSTSAPIGSSNSVGGADDDWAGDLDGDQMYNDATLAW